MTADPIRIPGADEHHEHPFLALPEPSPGMSPLEGLQADLGKPAERKPLLTLRIPQRPAVALQLDPNVIDAPIRKQWEDKAKERPTGNRARRRARGLTGTDTPIDPFHYACLVLAHTNTAILWNGQEAVVDGEPLTLKDEQVWQMVGAIDPEVAISKLFGNDQHVESMAGEVILASGVDDDLQEVDPTNAS